MALAAPRAIIKTRPFNNLLYDNNREESGRPLDERRLLVTGKGRQERRQNRPV